MSAPPARVRSFTRRGGRMPPTHQAAFDALARRYVLDLPPDEAGGSTTVDPAYRLDPVAVFGRRAPLVVEVGSGNGEALVRAARERPDLDLLGFEVWLPGIGHALAQVQAAGADGTRPGNLRLVPADAAQALGTLLAPGSVEEVWTFFPDPWPKTRHHKRRLVTPQFARTVATVLRPGGLWRLATDWPAYADHVRGVLDGADEWESAGTLRAPLRPVTRFERRGLSDGRPIADLAYRRR